MDEIKIQVPKKLAEFIDKLIVEGYFLSREDFIRCSSEILAESYGLSQTVKDGKKLADVLTESSKVAPIVKQKDVEIKKEEMETKTTTLPTTKTTPTTPTKETTTVELDVLDLFAGVKFEFEDALHAKYTMELMKMAKSPLPKDNFIPILESLAKKGKIERAEHNNKIIWKILENY